MTSIIYFLINLIGVLILLLIVQYWLNRVHKNPFVTEIVMGLSLTATVILCMLFPFHVSRGVVFNLGLIPIVLGCLYTNRFIAMWLVFLKICLRLMYGWGDWFPCISLLIFFLVITWLKPFYQHLTKAKRIIFSGILMFFMSFWIIVWDTLLFHNSFRSDTIFSYVFIQAFALILIVYIMESNREKQALVGKIIRMEKLEVVSHLAASISHEVRNPLTTTRGFLQLLNESKAIPEMEKQYITVAVDELDRAESVIRDYLTFAKPVSEEMESLNLKTEIERAVNIIVPLANMNSIQLFSESENSSIKGNARLFQQVLLNIMKNGIEAMPTGGTLCINGKVEKNLAQVTISDNGIGMNDLQKKRLGEPFFSTKELKGTGLGMMVAFRIVEGMNGSIKVESELGKGTKFILSFPVANE